MTRPTACCPSRRATRREEAPSTITPRTALSVWELNGLACCTSRVCLCVPWLPPGCPIPASERLRSAGRTERAQKMLALLHVVVQSYSLGSTLPARTRATRCSSARCLSEGQDYMLQELNPAKAGILCGPPSPPGHAPPWPPLPPLTPRPSAYRLRSCRCPNHSTSHAARPPLTAHRSPLTAHQAPGSRAQDPHVGQGGPGLACGRLQAEHRGHRRSHGTAQSDRQGAAGAGCAG